MGNYMRHHGDSSTPLISVILPVFNSEKYITRSIKSILDQTFINFELIIVNDGSSDNSLNIIHSLKNKDDRIVLISRENRGLVNSLNEALSIARGEWVARMDADDIALPYRFERQLKWLEQTGADICGSWVKFFGTNDRRILKHPESHDAIKMELLFGTSFAHPSIMMRTKRSKELGYNKAWEKCEDYDLWERAARANWKMTNVPEILLLYRLHDSQISNSASDFQQFLTQKIRQRYWSYICKSMNMDEAWAIEVLKLRDLSKPILNMNLVDSAFQMLMDKNSGEARSVVFDHMTRLYFRAASDCPDIVARWSKINKRYTNSFKFSIKLKLYFLNKLSISPNNITFKLLKKINFMLS